MTKKKILIGSLSNDLYRVAQLTYLGSYQAADKFLDQANRWIIELKKEDLKYYIGYIIMKLSQQIKQKKMTKKTAEEHLMYSVLLQNYCLKLK